MSKINRYDAAEELPILQELETGQATRLEVARKYDISVNTLVNGVIVMNCMDMRIGD